MTTMDTVYTVSPDAHGDPTLWRGTREDPYVHAVAMKCELDYLDPVLWPTLVAALCARTPDETTALEEEIREVSRDFGVIPAIRRYRERTNAGLGEARLAVERITGTTIDGPRAARAHAEFMRAEADAEAMGGDR